MTCVLVAFDLHISYLKILKATSYLKSEDCIFLASNEDAYIPMNDKVVMPGMNFSIYLLHLFNSLQSLTASNW